MKQLHNAIVVRFALAAAGVSALSLKREEGQTFVEYALILALIAILVGVGLTYLKDRIVSVFSYIGNHMP
jgi:Flp pilus assembly pilin Flp